MAKPPAKLNAILVQFNKLTRGDVVYVYPYSEYFRETYGADVSVLYGDNTKDVWALAIPARILAVLPSARGGKRTVNILTDAGTFYTGITTKVWAKA
jgi:hypothetical protein